MSLRPGTRLGPYEILALLGEGGMGEVFRARDTKLGRDVALKILPDAFASDADRLTRFEREARTLASLNHPQIAQIYGLEDFPAAGASDSGRRALVLELVEGEDLSTRIARGPVAIAEALAIARQIAEALEAAHELDIVHRDLKPANIKIRPDGTVKVLDFGIAKVLRPTSDISPDDVATIIATRSGVVIGTPAYMSPEQARGAEVTRRSDVWAFGAVLFEMLTGRRAFTGATASDVLATILMAAPDWGALPPTTPPTIVRLVRRCLEREPKARVHDIGDARLEIQDAERALREDPVDSRPSARAASMVLSSRRVVVAAAIAGIAALAAAAGIFLPRTEAGRPEVRLEMPPPSGMRFVSVPAVSSDGRQIVFGAAPVTGGVARLWLRPLAATAATELPGTTGASYPFWSADGRFVAFFADGKLKRVAVAGGNPITVCEASAGRGGLWLDDDTIVFAPTAFSPLVRVNAAGGPTTPLTRSPPTRRDTAFRSGCLAASCCISLSTARRKRAAHDSSRSMIHCAKSRSSDRRAPPSTARGSSSSMVRPSLIQPIRCSRSDCCFRRVSSRVSPSRLVERASRKRWAAS